jgi:hypothetical protein
MTHPKEEDVELVELDAAISKLCVLHRKLLACFTSPTGIAPPRRPKWLEPTMKDCDAALDGMVALERAKAEIERLCKVVCSEVLGGLLSDDESEALVGFVKELRRAAALRAKAKGGE